MNEKKKLSITDNLKSSEKAYKKKEKYSLEKKLFLWRIIINFIFSLILIAAFCLMWTSYSPVWKIFFFLTVWSFWANTFYIVSITVVDILLYNGYKKCKKFNLFIRNDLIRIFVPFSISTIIIYWELVLLGDKFQGIGHSILDICKSFFMHGLVLIFVCFDLFTTKHINKKNNCCSDIAIISIIMLINFAIVVLCKEVLNVYSYDFLMIADLRQMFASFFIIYLVVLNGYIVFYLISDNFFENEDIKEQKDNLYFDEESGDKLNDVGDKDENFFVKNKNKKNNINEIYLKSDDRDQIKQKEENIKEENEEDKKEDLTENKNDDNNNNLNEIDKDIKNVGSINDEISEKESDIDIDNNRKTLEIKNNDKKDLKINSFNLKNKIKDDRELLKIKKTKFGIKDIKIPENTFLRKNSK